MWPCPISICCRTGRAKASSSIWPNSASSISRPAARRSRPIRSAPAFRAEPRRSASRASSASASIRRERPELPAYVPPGPDNPMGDLALGLTWPSYYLHGTNKPFGVGRNVSHGCIHFYPEDIERLFHEVSIGTQVRVINQEVVTGWSQNRLYVAVFPSKSQVDEIDIEHPISRVVPDDLVQR